MFDTAPTGYGAKLKGADDNYRVGTITTMRSAAVIELLEQDGWVLARSKGSHPQFKHPTKPGMVTVPHPKAELPLGTLRSIYRQAGLPWRT